MTDLIKRSDALAACDIGPCDEWSDFTKSGYNLAADDCKRNIAALTLNHTADVGKMVARIEQLERERDGAYLERNQLVALLASIYPSGIKRTVIEGWHEDWHGCVYIDFPWGQASWHYHESQADLFSHLPPYEGQWDGHSTEAKYTAIVEASRAVLAELEGK